MGMKLIFKANSLSPSGIYYPFVFNEFKKWQILININYLATIQNMCQAGMAEWLSGLCCAMSCGYKYMGQKGLAVMPYRCLYSVHLYWWKR